MLRIRTLGASEITVAGARVGAEQPMTFALLLLLAVSGSAGLTRRQLAATLWPSSADRDRNHRLRSLLHRLRRIGAPVASSGATVSLGPSAIDFREFVTLPASLDVVRERAEAIGAVLPGLAGSSPALADHLDDIRDLIVGTMMRWLTAAVTLARAAGDWPLVERLACAAEQIDPADDRAVLQRAEAVCLTGGSERAIALLDELTARRGTDEEVRLAADTLRRRIVASVASDVSAGSPPLVGRDEIVKRLSSALTRAVGGRGGGVVLWGPAGIGKTRLLHELDAVRLTGAARLVRFGARPAHGLHPFAMILELAGCLLEEPGAAGCDPRAYALLVRARDADVPNDPARGATAGIEEAFCDAVAELLAAVSDESPTILTIDDVHAADGAIWRVLRSLVRWSADRRLLWVFAYRALHEAELAQLPEPSVLQRIRVQCLDATASTTLTRAITRSPATDHERLFDVAGGHPLLLQAVARTGGGVPAELEWLVDDWIARLPGESLRALRLVAALGTVTPRALADLGVFSRAELGVVLGDLERIGMIREERGALRAHRVWAAAALATLARSERATLALDASLAVPAMSER
jgi:DNA-binding SARP family transcriptional activator